MLDINHKVYIRAEKEAVYRTLTTAEGWDAWFTDNTYLRLASDGTGEILLRWTEFGNKRINIEDGGKILKTIPNELFVFQWSPGEVPTNVSFKISPYKDGSLVELNETGYSNLEKDLDACLRCAAGWGEALTLLKMYLEHGIVSKQDLMGD
jgi:uncharacterized protein YndB with AHSA1/START domain